MNVFWSILLIIQVSFFAGSSLSETLISDVPRRRRGRGREVAPFVAALLSVTPALAQAPNPIGADVDLLEPASRLFNALNSYLLTNVLDPAGRAYIDYVPPETRRGVATAFVNLREPFTVLSNVLLLDGAGAANATSRFAINSTVGVLGFYDVATDYGYLLNPRRLDQVLCLSYVPEGPYFVLPFFGAANLRDAVAAVATNFLQYAVAGSAYIPYRFLEVIAVHTPDSGQHEAQVFDYGATRDAYVARRRAACEAERSAM